MQVLIIPLRISDLGAGFMFATNPVFRVQTSGDGIGQNDSNGTEILGWRLSTINDILYITTPTTVGSALGGIDDISKWSIVP